MVISIYHLPFGHTKGRTKPYQVSARSSTRSLLRGARFSLPKFPFAQSFVSVPVIIGTEDGGRQTALEDRARARVFRARDSLLIFLAFEI